MHFLSGAGARRLVLLATALAVVAPALAAQESQLWVGGNVTVKLSSKWRFSEEATARFSDNKNGLYEIESNTLLGYVIGKGVVVWAGYTHNPTYADGHFAVMEHRAREQIAFDNLAALGPGRLSGRVRLEQRWREGHDGTGWRIRPFVKYSVPLKKGGRTAFVISIEPFLNLSTTDFQRTSGLDRTRTFIGVSLPLAKNLSTDIGYLNQHSFVPNDADNDDHVASFSVNLSI
jgi:uncharacterized protein DUF2490